MPLDFIGYYFVKGFFFQQQKKEKSIQDMGIYLSHGKTRIAHSFWLPRLCLGQIPQGNPTVSLCQHGWATWKKKSQRKNPQEWGKPGHSSGGHSILKKTNKQKSLRPRVVLGVRFQAVYPCWVPSKIHRKKQIGLIFYPLNTRMKIRSGFLQAGATHM